MDPNLNIYSNDPQDAYTQERMRQVQAEVDYYRSGSGSSEFISNSIHTAVQNAQMDIHWHENGN